MYERAGKRLFLVSHHQSFLGKWSVDLGTLSFNRVGNGAKVSSTAKNIIPGLRGSTC